MTGSANPAEYRQFAVRISNIEDALARLSNRDVLQNASIGANGLIVYGGGSIFINDGGSLIVTGTGSITLPSGTLSAGALSISGNASIFGTLTVTTINYGTASGGGLAATGNITTTADLGVGGNINGSGNISASGQVVSTGIINSTGTKANTVTLGYSAVYIDSAGNMGGNTSSRRFKTNLAPAVYDLDALIAIPAWQFQRTTDVLEMGAGAAPWQSGLMAEDVAPVAPLNVWYDEDNLVEGIRYEELVVPLLMLAKREHSALLDARARILTLEGHVSALVAKVGLP